jgi:predicted dehydrogenase
MKAALIGAGQIARQHLACLQGLPGVEIAAVCDLSPSVAEAAAERHQVGRWYTDYRKMLDEVRPNVVHVTTPPNSHYRLASDALNAGSHVIVEKPATVTFDELDGLLHRATERHLALVEDYNYLFNTPPREAKSRDSAVRRVSRVDRGGTGNRDGQLQLYRPAGCILGPRLRRAHARIRESV